MAEYYKNFKKNDNPTSDTITKRSYTNQLKASERGDSIVSPDTEAQSQADVDAMSIRDRLWDAANFAYQQQLKENNRSFDQAQSQFNNQLIGRGMQRSSYGAGINANLANKRIEAQNQIYGQQIADYENRLMQVEQQEEATRQFNAQMANNWLQQIIARGGTPSDELLAQLGLGREDYNSMVQQIDAGGGGGYSAPASSSGGKKTTTTNPPPATDKGLQDLIDKNKINTIGSKGTKPVYVGPQNSGLKPNTSGDYITSKPTGGFLTRGFETLKKK